MMLVGTKVHDCPPVPAGGLVLTRWPRQPRHREARHDESEETQQQSLPISACDNVEAGERNADAQQQAAEKPERRPFG